MAVAQIIRFGSEPGLAKHAQNATIDDTSDKAIKALEGVKTPQHFVLGTDVQDKASIQITSDWDGVQDYATFKNSPEFGSFVGSVRSVCGEPQSIFHVALDRSAFGPDGPATANVVEYVQVHFPASRVTPDFQKEIEEDFLRFDEIFSQDAKGSASWVIGWVLEEQEHETVHDEKTKCFFVIRAWESMELFQYSISSDAYKKSIPLLLGWKAPFKMWHVDRKAGDGLKVAA